MRYHIIGSNGLIGKRLIEYLSHHHSYIDTRNWSSKDPGNYFCLNDESSWSSLLSDTPENIVLLSWPGLPNYDSDHHIEDNLFNLIRLINKLRDYGLKRVIALGTCYEYGNKNGVLSLKIYVNRRISMDLQNICYLSISNSSKENEISLFLLIILYL